MLDKIELRKVALARLEDAEVLFSNKRFEGAIYLCGYAVEIALKCKICETLQWNGYPSSKQDFDDLKNFKPHSLDVTLTLLRRSWTQSLQQSFKTHSLDVLLTLSGVESEIKNNFLSEWSAIEDWGPEIRYDPIGSADEQKTRLAIESARSLLSSLKIS